MTDLKKENGLNWQELKTLKKFWSAICDEYAEKDGELYWSASATWKKLHRIQEGMLGLRRIG